MAVIKIVPMPGAVGDKGDEGAVGPQGQQGPVGPAGPSISNGASGIFVSQDGKTITVTNGIITSINPT